MLYLNLKRDFGLFSKKTYSQASVAIFQGATVKPHRSEYLIKKGFQFYAQPRTGAFSCLNKY